MNIYNELDYNDNKIFNFITQLIGPRKRLYRSKLQKQLDYNDQLMSENKQLNSYKEQHMFGKICKALANCNTMPIIWTYVIKADRTKRVL